MDNYKKSIPLVALGCALILGAAMYAARPVINVPVEVAPSGTPVMVSGDTADGGYGSAILNALQSMSTQLQQLIASETKTQQEEQFGGTSNWNSNIHTRGNLTVDGASTLTGNLNSSGTIQLTQAFPVAASSTVASSASSQILLQLTNTQSIARRLEGAGCTFRPSTYGGLARLTISGGPEGASATGTGANLWYDNANFTLSTASSTLTATSTLTTTNVLWYPNEVIRFMVAAPTSSLVGNCYVW